MCRVYVRLYVFKTCGHQMTTGNDQLWQLLSWVVLLCKTYLTVVSLISCLLQEFYWCLQGAPQTYITVYLETSGDSFKMFSDNGKLIVMSKHFSYRCWWFCCELPCGSGRYGLLIVNNFFKDKNVVPNVFELSPVSVERMRKC